MKKRVLIISQCFAPQNKIGAVRATKLTKYLLRMGYDVTVFAGKDRASVEDPLLARDLEQMPDIHILRERSFLRWWAEHGTKAAPQPANGATTTAPAKQRPLLNALYLYLDDRADAAFARACIRKAKTMGRQYDVVLSSYGPLSVHTVARQLKRMGIAKRWIADFRDEAAVPFAWQKGRLKRYNRMVEKHADAITAVSAGYLRVMGLEGKGRVIYNGYDPEDIEMLAAPPKRTDKLTFVHCGQMYGAQRDLSPVFRAIAELMEEGEISKSDVALAFAGRDTHGFVQQATQAGLDGCLEDHGFMPRDEALKLQQSSHVLLLPAWNLRDRQGNIPGKLLEYMMLKMPVVCCVSGDVEHSEIAGIMLETKIGICYEQANAADDEPRLKAYLADCMRAFTRGEGMPFAPNTDAVAAFTSEGMARKMANIMEEWT